MQIPLSYSAGVMIARNDSIANALVAEFTKFCEEDYIIRREGNIIKVVDTTLDDMVVFIVNIREGK